MTRYRRGHENNFHSLEEVHRYIIEIGGLAITLMDDVAKKFGFKFKPVGREPVTHPDDLGTYWIGPPLEPINFDHRPR